MLAQSQIQESANVNDLLDTATDCLRFVTEFFEVISQSGTHIYHSAVQLAPHLSIVRKLYNKQISSTVPKVVSGIPASWDSCTASAGSATGVDHVDWSPCGRLIAVRLGRISLDKVEVRDSNTLEVVFVLNPPSGCLRGCPRSLAFSPDGRLLACGYYR